jgi:hypothetical protein
MDSSLNTGRFSLSERLEQLLRTQTGSVWDGAWMAFTTDVFNYRSLKSFSGDSDGTQHQELKFLGGVHRSAPLVHKLTIGTHLGSVLRNILSASSEVPRHDHIHDQAHRRISSEQTFCDRHCALPSSTETDVRTGYVPVHPMLDNLDTSADWVRSPLSRFYDSDSFVPGCNSSTIIHVARIGIDSRPEGSLGLIFSDYVSGRSSRLQDCCATGGGNMESVAFSRDYVIDCAGLARIPELQKAFRDGSCARVVSATRAEYQATVYLSPSESGWRHDTHIDWACLVGGPSEYLEESSTTNHPLLSSASVFDAQWPWDDCFH